VRIQYAKVVPEALQALLGLERQVEKSGLEHSLLDLVKLRASQINGCAYCIDMHSKDAKARGESEERLYELMAWREAPFYSERERAALAWTEAVTLITEGHVPDQVYQEVSKEFGEAELVNLTLAIAAINAWNRMGIAFRIPPGSYHPAPAAPR